MITREYMQEIDSAAIKQLNIPGIVLMENASIGFMQYLPEEEDNYLIMCGTGNNGGDGLAVARHLYNRKKNVAITIVGDMAKASADFLTNFKICQAMKIEMKNYENISLFENDMEKHNIIIDALLGTGLKGDVREPFYSIIDSINSSGKKVYSIDIPSGLCANKGVPLGISVKAAMTVTMHRIKIGLNIGKEYTGVIKIASIGIPFDFTPKREV